MSSLRESSPPGFSQRQIPLADVQSSLEDANRLSLVQDTQSIETVNVLEFRHMTEHSV